MAKPENQPLVDRDKNYYNQKTKEGRPGSGSAPDAETQTAFDDNIQDVSDKEGTADGDLDRLGNGSEIYSGLRKDKTRIADQSTSNVEVKKESAFDEIMAKRFNNLAETSHTLKKLSGGKTQGKVHKKSKKYANEEVENDDAVLEYAYGATGPFRAINVFGFGANDEKTQRTATTLSPTTTGTSRQVRAIKSVGQNPNKPSATTQHLASRGLKNPTTQLRQRRSLFEAENPGVAASPTTSDNPTLGMYAMNGFSNQNRNMSIKPVLESIALQAAESFEALDDNASIPEFFGSELDQCAKVLDRLYAYVTKEQRNPPGDGATPVQKQNFMTKEEYVEESEEQKKFLDKTARLTGDPEKLEKTDFTALRKLKEAMFGTFAHLVRERNLD